MSTTWFDEREEELLEATGAAGSRGAGAVARFFRIMGEKIPEPVKRAASVAATPVEPVLDAFLKIMDLSSEYLVRRPWGFAAKHDIDPLAMLPVAMRPDDPDQVSLWRTFRNQLVLGPSGIATIAAERAKERITGEPSKLRERLNIPSGRLSDRIGQERYEAIREMPASEAYHAAFEGHPLLQFGHEVAFDPINLLSLGTSTALRGTALGATRVGRALIVADDFINRLHALPIEGTLGAGRKLGEVTGLLDDAPRGILAKDLHSLNRALEQQQRLAESTELRPPPPRGMFDVPRSARPATEAVTDATDTLQQAIRSRVDDDLLAAYRSAQEAGDETAMNLIDEALRARGIDPEAPAARATGAAEEVAEEVAETASLVPSGEVGQPIITDPETLEKLKSLPKPVVDLVNPIRLSPEDLRQSVEKNIRHIQHKVSGAQRALEQGRTPPPADLLPEGSYFRSFDEMQQSIAAYRAAGLDPASDPRWDYVYPEIQSLMGIDTGRPIRLAEMTKPYRAAREYNEHLERLQELGLRSQPKPIIPIDEIDQAPRVVEPSDETLGIVHPSFRKWQQISDAFWGRKKQEDPALRFVDPENVMDPRAQDAYKRALELKSVQKVMREADQAQQRLLEIQRSIEIRRWLQKAGGPSPFANVETGDDFIAVVREYAPDAVEEVQNLITKWGLPGTEDALKRRNVAILMAARDAWAKELGIKGTPSLVRRTYGEVAALLRSLNLMTPRQPLQNAVDELSKAALEGVPMDVLAREFQARITKSAGPVREVLASVGVREVPADWSGELLRDIPRDAAQGVREEFLRSSPFRRYEDTPVVGKLAGALGRVDEIRRDLDVGAQMAFREVSALYAFQKHLKDYQPRFIAEAEKLAGEQGKALGNALRQLDYLSSPDDIARVTLDATGDYDLARRLQLRWHRVINEAINDGTRMANRVHFDYTDIRRIDEWLQHFTLFHFWASRNLPYYAATFAEKPYLARALASYEEISEREREQLAYPTRMEGKLIRFSLPQWLAMGLFGDEMIVAIDPMIVLSFYDQTRERVIDDEQLPAAGEFLTNLERVGISPMPWFRDLFNILGLYGDQEPNSWFRHGGLVNAIFGKDWGAPRRNLIAEAREEVTGAMAGLDLPGLPNEKIPAERGVSGSLIRDAQINKVIREMAYRETGNPRDPRYEAAMGDPKNPIYREAARRVRAQQLVRELHGMISNVPFTMMSGTEAEARAATAALGNQPLSQQQVRELYESNDPATMYWGMPEGQRETQINTALAILQHFGPLRERDEQFMALLYAMYPEFQRYREWQRQQPPGANLSVDAYLGRLASPQLIENVLTDLYAAGVTPEQIQQYLLLIGKPSLYNMNPHQLRQMRDYLLNQ